MARRFVAAEGKYVGDMERSFFSIFNKPLGFYLLYWSHCRIWIAVVLAIDEFSDCRYYHLRCRLAPKIWAGRSSLKKLSEALEARINIRLPAQRRMPGWTLPRICFVQAVHRLVEGLSPMRRQSVVVLAAAIVFVAFINSPLYDIALGSISFPPEAPSRSIVDNVLAVGGALLLIFLFARTIDTGDKK